MANSVKCIPGDEIISGYKKSSNVLWFIFIGLWAGIDMAITGAMYIVSILFFPLGLQIFKMLKLVFFPFDKEVATNFKSQPVLNVLWLIFGGYAISLSFYIFSIIISIFVFTIPAAKQLRKIGKFLFFPFGAEIVQYGKYSSFHSSDYDTNLVVRHAVANPTIEINTLEGVMPLSKYLDQKKPEIEKDICKLSKIVYLERVLMMLPCFLILLVIILGIVYRDFKSIGLFIFLYIPILLLPFAFILFNERGVKNYFNSVKGLYNDEIIERKIVNKYLRNLWMYYPYNSDVTAKPKDGNIKELYLQINNPLCYPEDKDSISTTTNKIVGMSYKTTNDSSQDMDEQNDIEVEPLSEAKEEVVTSPESNSLTFDEIKKLKELLDAGAITQEEFDSKKKLLLEKIK